MVCLCLQVDSKCLAYTLPPKPPLQCANSVMNSKTVVCTIVGHFMTMTFDLWVLPIFSHVMTLTFGPQIFKNPSHCPIKCFRMTNIATGIFEWSYGSKTAFLLRFGHVVTLIFHLWTSNLNKSLTLPKEGFLKHKCCYLECLNGVVAPNLHFPQYLFMWLPLTFNWKKFLSRTWVHNVRT